MAQRAPLPMTTVLTTEVLQSLLTDEAACSALTKKKGAGGKIGAYHDSHGGFGGFELCLQLELWDYWWDHNVIMGLWYIVMVRVMSPKVRWSDCCLRATRTRTHPQTNTLGHVRFSSEIPGKILRKIRGNLSMEVLADGRISKWAVFHGSVSLESIDWNLWSTDCWFFRLVCLLPGADQAHDPRDGSPNGWVKKSIAGMFRWVMFYPLVNCDITYITMEHHHF